MRDTPAALAYAAHRDQARKHVLAVIWLSIMARECDRTHRPAAARDASLDAAAHVRCVIDLSTTTEAP